jgi:hypothetical protein
MELTLSQKLAPPSTTVQLLPAPVSTVHCCGMIPWYLEVGWICARANAVFTELIAMFCTV